MAHNNPNSKFSSKLCAKKSPLILDQIPKYLENCGSRKEYSIISEMRPSNTKSCHKLKEKYACSENDIEKLDAVVQEHHVVECENVYKPDRNSKKLEITVKLKEELSKYRKELRDYTTNTKELEEKYMKINSELNEMKEKHNRLIKKRNLPCGDFDTFSDSSSTGTEYSLQRKCTQIFDHSKSFLHVLTNKQPLKESKQQVNNDNFQSIQIADYHKAESVDRNYARQSENKENINSAHNGSGYDNSLQNVYLALKNVIDEQTPSQQNAEVSSLRKTIFKLQDDSERFSSIIEQQKNTLSDYRLRFVKAQQLVKQQQLEIEKLNSNNQQLEADASVIIDQLRHRVESKLRDMDMMSDIMRDDQFKRDRIVKENCLLNERIQTVQAEAHELKLKLEEMGRRKMATISRLKVAERDLKIFRNYNAALKEEKRRLNEQMKTMNEQLESMQNTSKRTLNRHREQSEKQKRDLQKRIFDLEMKLNRSQNSTTSLIQERDSLIAELQTQLNNLVHNFEVSQKHIRVLRRHIYSMCGNNSRQSVIRNRGHGEMV